MSFYLPDTEHRLASMALGNPSPEAARNLGMRPKEYWETRPMPSHPHHWTSAEYERFLRDHRYPGNTIDERLRHHVLMISEALQRGEYVPQDVMNDTAGVQALGHARMMVVSSDEGARRQAQTKEATHAFDAAMASHANFKAWLIALAKSEPKAHPQGASSAALGHYSQAAFPGHPRELRLMLQTVQTSQGQHGWYVVHDTAWGECSLYGQVARLEKDLVEAVYRQVLMEGALNPAEVARVTGPSPLFARVYASHLTTDAEGEEEAAEHDQPT